MGSNLISETPIQIPKNSNQNQNSKAKEPKDRVQDIKPVVESGRPLKN